MYSNFNIYAQFRTGYCGKSAGVCQEMNFKVSRVEKFETFNLRPDSETRVSIEGRYSKWQFYLMEFTVQYVAASKDAKFAFAKS